MFSPIILMAFGNKGLKNSFPVFYRLAKPECNNVCCGSNTLPQHIITLGLGKR